MEVGSSAGQVESSSEELACHDVKLNRDLTEICSISDINGDMQVF